MSLFSGLLLNMLGFQLPVVVANALGLLSEAAVPLAFLVLGATLSHFSLRGELLYSLSISAIKLLVFPFAIWFSAAKIWHIDGLWLYTAVMLAATPVGVSTQVMARRYHCSESLVASTIIISTVLSLFTLPLAMHWLQAG